MTAPAPHLRGFRYTLLGVLALVFTVDAALFLAFGNLTLTPATVAQLSGTYWNENPHLTASLARQAADTRVGVALLLAGALAQLLALWRGPQWGDLGPANRRALVVGLLVGLLALGAGYGAARWIASGFEAEARALAPAPPR